MAFAGVGYVGDYDPFVAARSACQKEVTHEVEAQLLHCCAESCGYRQSPVPRIAEKLGWLLWHVRCQFSMRFSWVQQFQQRTCTCTAKQNFKGFPVSSADFAQQFK